MTKIVSIESKDKGKRSFFCIDVTNFQSSAEFRSGTDKKRGQPERIDPEDGGDLLSHYTQYHRRRRA